MISYYLLVAIQFAGIAFFVGTGKLFPQHSVVFILLTISLLLGVWAILAMKFHTVTALPSVRQGGQLCTSGPYRLIRHPMYTAVVLLLLALLLNDYSHIRLIMLLIVFVDLIVKIKVEEKILLAHYEGYQAYMKKTKRIVPFVY